MTAKGTGTSRTASTKAADQEPPEVSDAGAVAGLNDGTQDVAAPPRSASNETPPAPGSWGPDFPDAHSAVPVTEEGK